MFSNCVSQSSTAQSSGEAEFYALGSGASDSLYCQSLLASVGINASIKLASDASAGRGMASRRGLSKRTRHIEARFLFLQEIVARRLVKLAYIPTKFNPADCNTKFHTADQLRTLKQFLCVCKTLGEATGPQSKLYHTKLNQDGSTQDEDDE